MVVRWAKLVMLLPKEGSMAKVPISCFCLAQTDYRPLLDTPLTSYILVVPSTALLPFLSVSTLHVPSPYLLEFSMEYKLEA